MIKKDTSHLWTSKNPLDRKALSIKLSLGLRDRLRTIPNWQEQVRDLLHQFVVESESRQSCGPEDTQLPPSDDTH